MPTPTRDNQSDGRPARPVLMATIVVIAASIVGVGTYGAGVATAQGTQTISSCTDITAPGKYVLGSDIQASSGGPCLNISASNVVLDGNGHTVDGRDTASVGILVHNGSTTLQNVTVRRVTVTDSINTHIRFVTVTDGLFEDSTVDRELVGIEIRNSTDITVRNNTAFRQRQTGIWIVGSDGNTVSGNVVRGEDILLSGADNNTIRDNRVFFTFRNIALQLSDDNTVVNNTVRGRPGQGSGLFIWRSHGNDIRDNHATKKRFGIRFQQADRNMVAENNASLNSRAGISLEDSHGNQFASNVVTDNNRFGIYARSSRNNRFVDDIAVDNGEWAFRSENGAGNNSAVNLTIDPVISFTSRDVGIGAVEDPPADPFGFRNIGHYVNATNTSADSWLFLNVSYTDSDAASVDESTLRMWRHNGTAWSEVPGTNGVDTAANVVFANITEFSVFAPLAGPVFEPIEIDIKPGSDTNPINPDRPGLVPVAVLNTSDFDPWEVNVSTVRFGQPASITDGGGAMAAHGGHFEDVDDDGDVDLVLHFPMTDTGFEDGDDEGLLVAETFGRVLLVGNDTITTVPPNSGGPGPSDADRADGNQNDGTDPGSDGEGSNGEGADSQETGDQREGDDESSGEKADSTDKGDQQGKDGSRSGEGSESRDSGDDRGGDNGSSGQGAGDRP